MIMPIGFFVLAGFVVAGAAFAQANRGRLADDGSGLGAATLRE
ncbi:MAG: hypothetical protein ACREEZ_11005 [Stellaceae bacterium]